MTVGLGLRLARPAERNRLADFCGTVFDVSIDYFRRRWEYDPGAGSFGVVLESGDEIIGYAHVFDRQLNAGQRVLRCAGLGNVAVSPAHRGRGHAGALVERCLDEAGPRGFEVSLLYTHIPGLYERNGYRVVTTADVLVNGDSGADWYEVAELSGNDRRCYSRDHGTRRGTVVRDERYWKARENWLPEEGWRIFKHRRADGYCLVQRWAEEWRIDEAAGGCAQMLREGTPLAGSWRWRLPAAYAEGLRPAPPTDSIAMMRQLQEGIALRSLESADAVFWVSDAF